MQYVIIFVFFFPLHLTFECAWGGEEMKKQTKKLHIEKDTNTTLKIHWNLPYFPFSISTKTDIQVQDISGI